MKLASRIARLEIESAFDVLVRARALEAAGRHIIHLEIGEPDFPTPAHIVEAAKRALDEGYTHYGPTQGLPELRAAIANHVSRTRQISVDASEVCVVPGGKPILFFPMLALLEPGDEVLYPDPGFPIYRSMVQFLEATPVPIPLVEERGFSLDIQYLRDHITDRTKLLILNSPQNPTGGVIPEADIRSIADLIRERDIMVLSDEIYSRLYYGEEPPFSVASLPGLLEKTIILDGFSKTYAMTGWRLGYGVMPVWLVEAVNKLMVNSNSCAATFTQRAAVAALNGPQTAVDDMLAQFTTRRKVFCQALDAIPGFRCNQPGGAFYAFANVKGTGMPSKELADYLLNEAGVACLDGGSFGHQGRGYIRFSFANSLDNLQEAARRIKGGVTPLEQWLMKIPILLALTVSTTFCQAIITDTGSTNRAGVSMTLGAKGRAVMTGHNGTRTKMKVQPELQKRFMQDLESALPLKDLKASHCMKSASFGSSIYVAYKGDRSPDLSCPGQADPHAAALHRDLEEFMALVPAAARSPRRQY